MPHESRERNFEAKALRQASRSEQLRSFLDE